MAQDKEQRKKAIANARKAHHKNMTTELNRERVDAYVTPETKQGLKDIKAMFPNVRNEGQAIDEAVKIAMTHLKKSP